MDDRLLTVEEVADLLRVSPSFVYKEAQAGRLARVKLGGAVRFRRADLSDYVEGKTR